MKILPVIYLFLMIFLYSCENVFHPQAEIPAYIKIDDIELSVSDPNLQGTSSHKISDVWVYVNDDLQGVYELPVTFPVLKSGNNSLKIIGGIKDNGIAATRVQYPFYDYYIDNSFSFVPDSIMQVNPVLTYNASLKFPWIEDFEDQGITIDSVSPSFTRISRNTDYTKIFEGNASGYISLDETKYIFKGVSNKAFTLPKGGAAVYLELNYKSTVNLNIVVISNTLSGNIDDLAITINPTNKSGIAEWNKIYVNLTSIISGNSSALDYKIAFYSNISNDGYLKGEIYLDNIKLVHF